MKSGGSPLPGAVDRHDPEADRRAGAAGRARRRRRQGRPPRRAEGEHATRAARPSSRATTRRSWRSTPRFGGPRLVWRVLADKSSTQLYDYMIDARTGEVLHRDNTVEFATGLAWDYFPGPMPLNSSGTATSRNFTTTGWLGVQRDDALGQQRPHLLRLPRRQHARRGRRGRAEQRQQLELPADALQRRQLLHATARSDFPCSWDSFTADSWQTNSKQNATQIFYFVNNFHDWLNDRPDRLHRGGGQLPADQLDGPGRRRRRRAGPGARRRGHRRRLPRQRPLQQRQHGHRADGQPPRMQMYLMSGMGSERRRRQQRRRRVGHLPRVHARALEPARHSTTTATRRSARSSPRSMGEGWSDWYAMDFLVNKGYDAGQRRDRRRQHRVLRRRRRRLPHPAAGLPGDGHRR